MSELLYVTCDCYVSDQYMSFHVENDKHLNAIIEVMQNNHHAQHWELKDFLGFSFKELKEASKKC